MVITATTLQVIKEGGKRGVEIEGVADMGGLRYFCTAVAKPEGNIDYLEKSVDAMNEEADPTAEERRGTDSDVNYINTKR